MLRTNWFDFVLEVRKFHDFFERKRQKALFPCVENDEMAFFPLFFSIFTY